MANITKNDSNIVLEMFSKLTKNCIICFQLKEYTPKFKKKWKLLEIKIIVLFSLMKSSKMSIKELQFNNLPSQRNARYIPRIHVTC